MRRILITLLLTASSVVCCAQTDNTYYAKRFPGADVGAKIGAAMQTCVPDVNVPCIIVLDPSLNAYANGIFPTLCAQCYLWDFRHGVPVGEGAGTDSNCGINDIPCTDTPNTFVGGQVIATGNPGVVGLQVSGSSGETQTATPVAGSYAYATGSGGTCSVQVGATLATGDLILGIQDRESGAAVTDTDSNSYSSSVDIHQNTYLGFTAFLGVAGQNHQPTLTFNSNNCAVMAFSGTAASSFLDGEVDRSFTGWVNPELSPTLSTSNANDLLIAVYGQATNLPDPRVGGTLDLFDATPFEFRGSGGEFAVLSEDVNTAGNYQISMSQTSPSSTAYGLLLFAVKEAGSTAQTADLAEFGAGGFDAAGDAFTRTVAGAPSGTCKPGAIALNTSTNALYACGSDDGWHGQGGSGAIKVNGTSIPNANLSSTTPAASVGNYVDLPVVTDGTNIAVQCPIGTASFPGCLATDGTIANSSGTIGLATVNTGPGTCGDATHVCQVTVTNKGLTTNETPVAISAQTVTLTGDATGSGSGSIATTLATVNSGPGTCGDATHVCSITTDLKGRVTAQTATAITSGGLTALTGDGTASGSGSQVFTLATVNVSPGTYTYGTLTVNGKGLVTAASNGTSPGCTTSNCIINNPTTTQTIVNTTSAMVPLRIQQTVSGGGAPDAFDIGDVNAANDLLRFASTGVLTICQGSGGLCQTFSPGSGTFVDQGSLSIQAANGALNESANGEGITIQNSNTDGDDILIEAGTGSGDNSDLVSLSGAFNQGTVANQYDVVSISNGTNYQVSDCAVSCVNPIGIESGNPGGGTANVTYVGRSIVNLDTIQTVTPGDYLCASTTTAGRAHDNGTTACTTARIGYVTVAGSSVGIAHLFISIK